MNLVVSNTSLRGVKYLTTDRFEDLRGEYGGVYDEELYFANGLTTRFVADQVSFSYQNVLRGLHGDTKTTKLVQCLHGTVYSVVADCDPNSPDFGKWEAFILSDKNHKQLWIPPLYGLSYFAQTETIVFTYKLSHSLVPPEEQFTYRWDDPLFQIHWPSRTPVLSARDKNALLYETALEMNCAEKMRGGGGYLNPNKTTIVGVNWEIFHLMRACVLLPGAKYCARAKRLFCGKGAMECTV